MAHEPIDLTGIRTYPVRERFSKVSQGQAAKTLQAGASFDEFLDSLPDILGAAELRALVDAVVAARRAGKPVILGFGAHLIKCGVGPLVIDAMERGIVTAIVANGASIVHDSELSAFGFTSEDVAEALEDGSFGMAEETAALANAAIARAEKEGRGLGAAVGAELSAKAEHPELSLFATAHRLDLTATVHIAIGTDIIHMHPGFDPAAAGRASHRDFRILCTVVSEMHSGGVYINAGSAVILPEVFLKALTVARNLKGEVNGFTTADLDFIRHYRSRVNVVERPTMSGNSRGLSITGQHEILLPLLFAAIKNKLKV